MFQSISDKPITDSFISIARVKSCKSSSLTTMLRRFVNVTRYDRCKSESESVYVCMRERENVRVLSYYDYR